MGTRKRVDRVKSSRHEMARSIEVRGISDRKKRSSWAWVATLAIAGAGTAIWMGGGARDAILFTMVAGALSEWLRQNLFPTKGFKAMPFRLAFGCAGVIAWITAASAYLVAAILRTVGVPQIEALGVCYVVAAGSGGVTMLVYNEWIGRKSNSFLIPPPNEM